MTQLAGAAADVSAQAARLTEIDAGRVRWMTTAAWETAGRALGLPDEAAARALLEGAGAAPSGARGRSATHVLDVGAGRRLHVRRVLHGGLLGPIWGGRIAGFGRPRRELAATAALHASGAPVPEPAFAVALRDGALLRACFCTVHVDGSVDAIRFLASAPDGEAIRAAARACGDAVRRLHDTGARHADLHLGNLLLRAEGEGLRAWVIDLDRARLGRPPGRRRRRRELQRLRRSLDKHVRDTDVAALAASAFAAGYGRGG